MGSRPAPGTGPSYSGFATHIYMYIYNVTGEHKFSRCGLRNSFFCLIGHPNIFDIYLMSLQYVIPSQGDVVMA